MKRVPLSSLVGLPVAAALDGVSSYFHTLRREHLVAFYLSSDGTVVAVRRLAVGRWDVVLARLRDVFAPALRCGARSVVLAHNHPNGTSSASRADVEFTRLTRAAGALLGVWVAGHAVFSPRGRVWVAGFTRSRRGARGST